MRWYVDATRRRGTRSRCRRRRSTHSHRANDRSHAGGRSAVGRLVHAPEDATTSPALLSMRRSRRRPLRALSAHFDEHRIPRFSSRSRRRRSAVPPRSPRPNEAAERRREQRIDNKTRHSAHVPSTGRQHDGVPSAEAAGLDGAVRRSSLPTSEGTAAERHKCSAFCSILRVTELLRYLTKEVPFVKSIVVPQWMQKTDQSSL